MVNKKEREKLENEREQLVKRYFEISKVLSRTHVFTKVEALHRIYEIKGGGAKLTGGRVQGRIRVPMALVGIKVKLIEVK